jgi:ABC-type antimicrobial peptide transport system permease subunit
LKDRALARLGNGSWLLYSQDRFFREQFPMRVRCQANSMALRGAMRLYQKTSSELPVCINPDLPERLMLVLQGTVARDDAARRANSVQIIGVSDFSPVFFSAAQTLQRETPRRIALTNLAVPNASLASGLGIKAGDIVLVRFAKAARLSTEAALAPRDEQAVTLRLPIHTVSTNGEIAGFSPVPTPRPPLTLFVPLSELAHAVGLQEVRDTSYSITDDSTDDQPPKRSIVTERQQINFVNAWLSPEVVGLRPSPKRRVSRLGETFGQWLRWMKSRLNLPLERDGLPKVRIPTAQQFSVLSDLVRQSWDFENVEIAQVGMANDTLQLVSKRVFIDPPIVRAALAVQTNAQSVVTYLLNLLRVGTNVTPYSMVTAAGLPWTPADMRDDEILVSQWLAEDLQVKPGDEIALSCFDPESGARLVERTNTFRVRAIVPMEMPWADRTLMPDFPGIEKAESTSDWDAGFPLTYKIRQKDEDYWKKYRGTPKAFITLAAGQRMWANRFGNLTAIRFPIPTNSVGTRSTASQTSPKDGDAVERVPAGAVEEYRAALEKKILANLKPEELGLRFEPVREQAVKAAEESQDFGGLFLGFSLFVIAAALLLMALLFSLGLEQRAPEIGTLLALGFTPKQVRRLLLCEGIALSFLGGILGALGGRAYARVMLHGLTTIWRDAVGASALSFHFTGQTLAIGLFASVLICAITIWLTLRKFVRRPARELLVGEIATNESKGQSRKSKVIAIGSLLLALGLVGWTVVEGDTANAGAFFGAGALVLLAGLAAANARLVRLANFEMSNRTTVSLPALGLRGCARRRKRSLATIAMLACGSFLIVSIGVFRLDANRDATKKTSGTGGFALIGETTIPVVHDLNSPSGRDFFALNESDLQSVSFVPFRVHEGDEASCLNLNRAQRPRLLGVKPEMLAGRFGFSKRAGWTSLINTRLQPGESATNKMGNRLNGFPRPAPSNTGLKPGVNEMEIPAIGDANSIQWAMHKKVGDTIDYVDERGQPFKVRIVGAVANCILQGQLIIDEAEFVKRFPSESSYRMFLIDAPSNRVSQVSATLSRAMQDVGLELTPAAERLAQFNAVQNTYLGTFQVLGGLGLLLGSVGLGIVVLRNVLERRGELAVLLAVGFRKATLQRLLLIENGALLAAGLALGIAAAAVAVLPALLSPSAQLPFVSLGLTLGAVLINGALWTWAATRLAVRGDLLKALRNE